MSVSFCQSSRYLAKCLPPFYQPRSGMVMGRCRSLLARRRPLVTFLFGFFACLILVGKKKTFGFYICHSLFLAALVYNLIFFSKISFEFLFKICYKNFNNLNLIQYYQFFDSLGFFLIFFDFLKEFQILMAKPRGW